MTDYTRRRSSDSFADAGSTPAASTIFYPGFTGFLMCQKPSEANGRFRKPRNYLANGVSAFTANDCVYGHFFILGMSRLYIYPYS